VLPLVRLLVPDGFVELVPEVPVAPAWSPPRCRHPVIVTSPFAV
jgi:hypothetical protein